MREIPKVFTPDGLVISTVETKDIGWETAIGVQGGEWHPVQRYLTRSEALAGHEDWVARAPSLVEITDLGLPGGWYEPRSVVLVRPDGERSS